MLRKQSACNERRYRSRMDKEYAGRDRSPLSRALRGLSPKAERRFLIPSPL